MQKWIASNTHAFKVIFPCELVDDVLYLQCMCYLFHLDSGFETSWMFLSCSLFFFFISVIGMGIDITIKLYFYYILIFLFSFYDCSEFGYHM